MRKKKYVQKQAIGMAAAMLICGAASMQASASTTNSAIGNVVAIAQPTPDNLQNTNLIWLTRTVNGVRYKRLYDTKTGKWLTDWIRCT